MNDLDWWVWLIVALVVIAIVVAIAAAARRAGEERRREQHREKAAGLRNEAMETSIDAQRTSAAAVAATADADEKRLVAERLQEEAARADLAAKERVREADQIDPDVSDEDRTPGDHEAGRDRDVDLDRRGDAGRVDPQVTDRDPSPGDGEVGRDRDVDLDRRRDADFDADRRDDGNVSR
jgi:type II secretory pathway pseudopilin PulG